MKRIILLCLCVLLLNGCSLRKENDRGFLIFRDSEKSATSASSVSPEKEEKRCCWLTYLELNPDRIRSEAQYRVYLSKLLQPLTRFKTTDLFVQVRPFADAIYPSALFEASAYAAECRGAALPFDYLSVILDVSSTLGMRVHAWLNPYRIATNPKDALQIDPDSPVGVLLRRDNGAHVLENASGVWLQPASAAVQKLILDGVREILSSYPVAGIHIDDYFYPEQTGGKDAAWYQSYRTAGGMLSLEDWRAEQINTLLRAIYRTVHAIRDRCVFSVSPGGNPQTDRAACCADVARWCKEDGFCDWIIPQLYFGFRNETVPFLQTAKRWQSFCKDGSVQLIAGLALYKAGKPDPFAGAAGKDEWIRDSAVLAKQLRWIRRLGFNGFALFSAQFVNFQEKVCAKACQMLERVI